MIRRLLEAHYFQNRQKPKTAQIKFWFQELRTPELLEELSCRYSSICKQMCKRRPLLTPALAKNRVGLEQALAAEENVERLRDREYWMPLRQELEKLRHKK